MSYDKLPIIGGSKQPKFIVDTVTGATRMESEPGFQEFPATLAMFASDQLVAQIATLCSRMVISDLVRLGVIQVPVPEQAGEKADEVG